MYAIIITIHYCCETYYESLLRCCHLSAPVVTSDTVTATYVTKGALNFQTHNAHNPYHSLKMVYSQSQLKYCKLIGILCLFPKTNEIHSLTFSLVIPVTLVRPWLGQKRIARKNSQRSDGADDAEGRDSIKIIPTDSLLKQKVLIIVRSDWKL